MKAGDRRLRSTFIVFECLETMLKHKERVFEVASSSNIINEQNKCSHLTVLLLFLFV